MAYSRDHLDAPRFAGTHSVAGVPFTIPVLIDISLFLRTLAQLFSDPYAAQTLLKEFQSLYMGKLSIVQLNACFIALSFRITTYEEIFMDYYKKALSPAVFQRTLTRPEWEPCTTVRELMAVAVIAARPEDTIAASHRQLSHLSGPPTVSAPIQGVVVPSDPSAMDVGAIGSNNSFSKQPVTRYPFAFYHKLCQARRVCWCCQHTFDDIHRYNKAAGKPVCSNSPVSGPEMDAYCVSCTSSSPTPITGPPAPVQSVASTVLAPTSPSPAPASPSVPLSLHAPHPNFVSPYYHQPPHMTPSQQYLPPSFTPTFMGSPGPAGYPLTFIPTAIPVAPPLSGPLAPSSPSSAAHVSAVFSEYQDLDSPRYYNLPSTSPSAPNHLVDALTFSAPLSSDPRLVLRVMLLLGKRIVHALALIGPGSTGDFINSCFINLHPFTLETRTHPLNCTAFDGSPSVGGPITHVWHGRLSIWLPMTSCFTLWSPSMSLL